MAFVVSKRESVVFQAILDLIQTLLVCILLLFSIYQLNKDMARLILNPIEKIIKKINKIIKNPSLLIHKKQKFHSVNKTNEVF